MPLQASRSTEKPVKMQPQRRDEQSFVRRSFIHIDRPDSSQVVDLHIYVIPKKIWKDGQHLAENEAIDQAISAGFVRAPQNLSIFELRQYIYHICDQDEDFPKEFLYLRSVGRCLTKVKPHQEIDLKVKNFRPPITLAPEIYLLENKQEDDFEDETTPSMKSNEGSISSRPSLVYQANGETSSSRGRTKLDEEQDRLRLRQADLARQRDEIEEKQPTQTKPSKTKKVTIKFQAPYLDRPLVTTEDGTPFIELEEVKSKDADATPRRTQRELVTHSNHLEEVKAKREELESNRTHLLRRIQYLYTQIALRRKEERDLWKHRYFLEKKKTAILTEQTRMTSKNQTDLQNQLDQTKIRLYNTTKLRQSAEEETLVLKRELQQIRSTMKALEKHRLLKQGLEQLSDEPISFNITLQY